MKYRVKDCGIVGVEAETAGFLCKDAGMDEWCVPDNEEFLVQMLEGPCEGQTFIVVADELDEVSE